MSDQRSQQGGEPNAEPQRRMMVLAIPLVILVGLGLLVLVWQLMQ